MFTQPAPASAPTHDNSNAAPTPDITLTFGEVRYSFAPALQQLTGVQTGLNTLNYGHVLGEGANSKTELFRNSAMTIVVKSSKKANDPHYAERCKKEKEFLEKVYPGQYFVHTCPLTPTLNGGFLSQPITFFYMPFVPGMRLGNALFPIQDEKTLLAIYLAVATELKRIHDLGIIHGDITNNNILINYNLVTQQFKATFIDFEWAYYKSSDFATKINLEHRDCPHFSEDRTLSVSTWPKPDVTQDIHMLKYLIELQLNDVHPHLKPACLVQYCQQALQPLDNLITILTQALAATMSTTAALLRRGIATQEKLVRLTSDGFIHIDSPPIELMLSNASQQTKDRRHSLVEDKQPVMNLSRHTPSNNIFLPIPTQCSSISSSELQDEKQSFDMGFCRQATPFLDWPSIEGKENDAQQGPNGTPFMEYFQEFNLTNENDFNQEENTSLLKLF